MNSCPIEQQNSKATSSITGDTLCSQPPAQEELAITPAMTTTSKLGQMAPPAVVGDSIDTLKPESSGEMTPAVSLRYTPLETENKLSQRKIEEEIRMRNYEARRRERADVDASRIKEIPLHQKWDENKDRAAKYMAAARRKVGVAEASKKNISPRPKDLLEAFERIYARSTLSICHKQPKPGKPLLSTGTHMDIAALDAAPWGLLFFQRPDNWIQTALIPRDGFRKAILLQPRAEAAKNSPLWCDMDENHSKSTLRLFFSCNSQNELLLKEGRIEFGDNGEISRSILDLQIYPIRKFLYGTWDEDKIILACTNSSGSLIRYQEQADGSWPSITYPREITISSGDFVYDSIALQGSELRVRTLNQTRINLYAVVGVVNLVGINNSNADDMETEDQDMDWHGFQPDSESFSCQLIRCIHNVDGVLYKTASNEVYLRRGNPWCYNKGDKATGTVVPKPEQICTIKAGSRFVVFMHWRELIYLSLDDEIMRIKFTVDESGEIIFGNPCSVFGEDWLTATLDDLSLPGPLADYQIQRG